MPLHLVTGDSLSVNAEFKQDVEGGTSDAEIGLGIISQMKLSLCRLELKYVELDDEGNVARHPSRLSFEIGSSASLELKFAEFDDRSVKCLLIATSSGASGMPLEIRCDMEVLECVIRLSAPSYVLGILEKTDEGWYVGAPGITITHPIDLWLGSKGALQTMKGWNSGLPNALLDPVGPLDPKHYSHWLAHGRPEKLDKLYQDIGVIRGTGLATGILKNLMTSWEDSALNDCRQRLVEKLLADGANWGMLIGESPGKLSALDRIVEMHSRFPNWCRLFLAEVDDSAVLAYASTPARGDTLYALDPRRCLLDCVSEATRAASLERELGL